MEARFSTLHTAVIQDNYFTSWLHLCCPSLSLSLDLPCFLRFLDSSRALYPRCCFCCCWRSSPETSPSVGLSLFFQSRGSGVDAPSVHFRSAFPTDLRRGPCWDNGKTGCTILLSTRIEEYNKQRYRCLSPSVWSPVCGCLIAGFKTLQRLRLWSYYLN